MPQTALPGLPSAPLRFEVFQYPSDPSGPAPPEWACWTSPDQANASAGIPDARDTERAAAETVLRAGFDIRLADEVRKAFEGGREKGRQEGRQAEHDAQAASVTAASQERMRQAAELVDRFAVEHERHFQAIEHEVVELALAVAARILRREAQMDPLLLTGAVRVALGQLAGSTHVTLKVPSAELDLWTEAMAVIPKLALKPAVVAGEGMRLGDCQVETSLGSVDLGIRSQLGEIERGFFDRAGGRRTQPAAVATLEQPVAKDGTAA